MHVVSVGTCNMDFIFSVPEFVEPDSEMYIDDIHIIPGGSALNFAVWLSALGFSSGIVAVTGRDVYGEIIRSRLESEGVSTSCLSVVERPTGMAFISVDGAGRRSIYSYMGANAELEIGTLEERCIRAADAVHISGCYVEVAHTVAKIRELSFSPGGLLASYGLDVLEPVLRRTEVLFLNDDELEVLTGSRRSGISRLLDLGVDNVVVTHGPGGASFFSADHSLEMKVEDAGAIDTTGAGDAFAAGFMSEWLRGSEPSQCLRGGHRVALNVISRFGAL